MGVIGATFVTVMILAIETATSVQSLALVDGERVLAHHSQEASGSHTKSLIPAIDQLLSSVSFNVSHLKGVAVSIGPGSFTGLRVGLATALGFRLTLGIPIVTVSTLEALAWNFCETPLPLCPLLKARTGEVYWASFRWEGKKLVRLMEDRVGTVQDLARSVSGPTLVFGEGGVVNRNEFMQLSHWFEEPPNGLMSCSAVNVGLASVSRFKAAEFAGKDLGPHYIQRSYAEMKARN